MTTLTQSIYQSELEIRKEIKALEAQKKPLEEQIRGLRALLSEFESERFKGEEEEILQKKAQEKTKKGSKSLEQKFQRDFNKLSQEQQKRLLKNLFGEDNRDEEIPEEELPVPEKEED